MSNNTVSSTDLFILTKYKELYAIDEQVLKLMATKYELDLELQKLHTGKETILSLISNLIERQKNETEQKVNEPAPVEPGLKEKSVITMVPTVAKGSDNG